MGGWGFLPFRWSALMIWLIHLSFWAGASHE
jgi:hypothetical protein